MTTANFIFPDWKSKTNAVASFHFGRLAGAAPAAPADGFGSDLLEYYAALKAIGHRPPPAWKVDKGQRAPTDAECAAWAVLPLGWLADYDYSGARARLVASVPGTSAGVSAGRHAGPALHRWGSCSTGPTWPHAATGTVGPGLAAPRVRAPRSSRSCSLRRQPPQAASAGRLRSCSLDNVQASGGATLPGSIGASRRA